MKDNDKSGVEYMCTIADALGIEHKFTLPHTNVEDLCFEMNVATEGEVKPSLSHSDINDWYLSLKKREKRKIIIVSNENGMPLYTYDDIEDIPEEVIKLIQKNEDKISVYSAKVLKPEPQFIEFDITVSATGDVDVVDNTQIKEDGEDDE